MNAVVVDTDIVSFLFKGHPAASLYKAVLTGRAMAISFMTLLNWSAGRFKRSGAKQSAAV
jgi:hypothetical protein